MPKNQNHSGKTRTHVMYFPAQLCKGKEWYVHFRAWDPRTEMLKRKKIKINRIASLTERERYARKMIANINRDLEAGWSPWVEQVAAKGMHRICDAVETFLRNKLLTLEPNSKRSYISLTHHLLDWLKATKRSDMLAVAWAKQDTTDYLDYLLRERDLSPRTYNNYLVFCRTLFNWLVEREYMAGNPFLKQKKLRVKEKTRAALPEVLLFRIQEYLEVNDIGFLLCCYLLFYTEIRPGEQCGLKVRDVQLGRQVINVGGSITKNKKSRFPTIPDVLVKFLKDVGIDRADPNHFLISTNFLPGRVPTDPRTISRRWARLRQQIDIPMKYQFYSLRDSGIIYMLENGVDPKAVMDQAGHADLEMTTTYSRHAVNGAVQSIKELKRGF